MVPLVSVSSGGKRYTARVGTAFIRAQTAWRRHSSVCSAALIAAISFTLHLIPFVFYSANPLGYDTGFYRRYLIEPLLSFPSAPVPGLGADALLPRIVLDALHFLQISPDIALYGSYIVFSSLLPVLFFFWLKPFLGARAAFIGGLFLAVSPVGYTAYWYMLYKNAFALCLLLLAFILYERRLFWPLVALDIGIAFSHKTSAIIYLLTLCVLAIVDYRRLKEILVHAALVAACFALIFFNTPVVSLILKGGAVAIFLDWKEYIVFSVPLFIGALGAIAAWKRIIMPRSLIAFALASFAFPVLTLPFYQRIFVFTDIALAAFAAYGINFFISRLTFDTASRSTYFFFTLLCIIGGLQLGNLQAQVRQLRPLEASAHLNQIAAIGALVPPDALLLTTNREAPWYQGWTRSHIAAPGMLYDTHDLEAWTTFWSSTSTPERTAFLSTFSRPLYISTLGDFSHLIGEPLPCLTSVAPKLLRNDCS